VEGRSSSRLPGCRSAPAGARPAAGPSR
jgi:hypothetical protein